MLPNWLYGKSKSKLAELLGGGGTPSDYNQVKAQVTQNTENIASLDTSNQALTNQSNSIVNVLGAKNLLNPIDYLDNSRAGVTSMINSDGTVSLSGTATITDNLAITKDWNIDASNLFDGMLGQKVILSDGTDANTFIGIMFYDANGNMFAHRYTQNGDVKFTISQKPATYSIYCNIVKGVDYTGVVLKPMIRPASITDDTYVPYTMTNQELTKKLTANANLGTAVDLSSYTAYSNLYTAPSDGYVHFVSAASGSTARIIYTYGNNTSAATDPHFTHSTSANNKAFEIFIKKGLKVYVDGLQSGDTISFYPLSAEL